MPEPGVVRRFARGTQTMRIGERLVQDGLITPEQLAAGLRIQAERGGRLGSTLIDLGYLDQDFLAEYLGRYHGMPPALARHFDRRDPALPTRLPPELAARWGVIPIATLAGDRQRIAVAVTSPLPSVAIEQISAALGCEIVTAITAEIRVHYYLERVYGISHAEVSARAERQQLPVLLADEDVEYELSIHLDGDPLDDAGDITGIERAGEQAYLEALGDAVELDLDQDFSDALAGEARAARTESSKPGGSSPESLDRDAVPQEIPDSDSTRATNPVITVAKLGRIPLRRLAPSAEPPRIDSPAAAVSSLDEVLRALRRVTSRDKVGDLAVRALHDLFERIFDAGVILVLRGTHAVGWKGFVRGERTEPIEAVALPLDLPSVIGNACRSRQIAMGPLRAGGSEAERHLWTALGAQTPRTVAVAPVVLETQLACVLYAHTQLPPERALPIIDAPFPALAGAISAAFERLIRAAQR